MKAIALLMFSVALTAGCQTVEDDTLSVVNARKAEYVRTHDCKKIEYIPASDTMSLDGKVVPDTGFWVWECKGIGNQIYVHDTPYPPKPAAPKH
jgi:hypothetical protein